MKKILVPVEKFDEKFEILDIAVELAKKYDATITLLYVDNVHIVVNQLQYDVYIDVDKIRQDARNTDFMKKIIDAYKETGVKVESKELIGDPASEIIEEAKRGEYDLVIMKTHGMKPSKRFMLGSVTNKVVHHVEVPILVVR